jgi:hypothetical protein
MRLAQWVLSGLLAGMAVAGASSACIASPEPGAGSYLPGAVLAISCENGANYRLSSGVVAIPGDIVTAHLHLSRHHSLPVRLIPMGEGYRYAGRGVWLDGIREHALLYFSKYRPLACVVTHT